MASVWWSWGPKLDRTGFEELRFPFTIWNDVEPQHDSGLYFMLCNAWVEDEVVYFGLQSNVQDGSPPHGWMGKGLIFSRWGTRDLANARTDGFTQSSGHEGDFIGVRRLYEWGAGDYEVRFAPDGEDPEGRWFGLWITDLEDGTTTWIGSLRFPLGSRVEAPTYSTVEIYGLADPPFYWYIPVLARLTVSSLPPLPTSTAKFLVSTPNTDECPASGQAATADIVEDSTTCTIRVRGATRLDKIKNLHAQIQAGSVTNISRAEQTPS